MNPSEVRELFPILKKRAYMFSGGIAPTTTRSLEALPAPHRPHDLRRRRSVLAHLRRFPRGPSTVRPAHRRLRGRDSGYRLPRAWAPTWLSKWWSPFPGATSSSTSRPTPRRAYPWMLPTRAHVERRFVEGRDGLIHLDDLAEAINDDTVAVSISHVSQETGFRHDLGAVARVGAPPRCGAAGGRDAVGRRPAHRRPRAGRRLPGDRRDEVAPRLLRGRLPIRGRPAPRSHAAPRRRAGRGP